MSAQPLSPPDIDWRAYLERNLPVDRPLLDGDLEALGYRGRWDYELLDGTLYCHPRPGALPMRPEDLASDLEWTHWVVELIEGMLIVTGSAPTERHHDCVASLHGVLKRACPPHLKAMSAPFEYVSEAPFVMQPDVFVARRPIGAKRCAHTPVLAVEVLSPSTWKRDRGMKQIAYRRAGVPHYWLIDPEGPTIEAMELVDDGYELRAIVGPGEVFSTTLPFPVSFDPADLLDDA